MGVEAGPQHDMWLRLYATRETGETMNGSKRTTHPTVLLRAMAVLGACLIAGSIACVSSGKYDAMVAERDMLNQEKSDLTGEVSQLEQQLTAIEQSRQQLEGKLSEREKKVNELKGTYDGLVADLRDELASGQVQIEQLRNGIRLNVADEILFPSGSAKLDEGGETVLKKVAAQVVKSPNRVEVAGHTDDVPISSGLQKRYPTNWELAAARAASVVRLMEQEGIQGSRLRAASLGQHHPVAANDSEQGRSRNRRIEIKLIPPTATDLAKAPSTEKSEEVPASIASD
jgi:chemotaxis protein MotB